MNDRQWADRERYGTSYGEWVLGNFIVLGLCASVGTLAVGAVGTGIDAVEKLNSGGNLFDKFNYGDGYTDWTEVAVDGAVLSAIMLTLCFLYVRDQESRRSIMGIVMPRE